MLHQMGNRGSWFAQKEPLNFEDKHAMEMIILLETQHSRTIHTNIVEGTFQPIPDSK